MSRADLLKEAFRKNSERNKQIISLRAHLAAALAQLAEKEGQLCRIKKATNETKGHVDNLWHKIDIILDLSSPCPHAKEAERLRGKMERRDNFMETCLAAIVHGSTEAADYARSVLAAHKIEMEAELNGVKETNEL